MRLREIQWILDGAVPNIGLVVGQARGGTDGVHYREVTGLVALQRAAAQLIAVHALKGDAEHVLNHPIFRLRYDNGTLPAKEIDDLVKRMGNLHARTHALKITVDQLLEPEDPNAFYFVLPLTGSFEDVERRLRHAKGLFEQPLRRLLGAEIQLRGIERGSLVLDVLTVAKDAAESNWPLFYIVGLYRAAKEIFVLKEKKRRDDQEVEALRLDNEHKKLRNRLFEAEVEARTRKLAEDLVNEFPEGNVENVAVLVAKGIAELSEDLAQGAKLQLPANVPQSVSNAADPDLLPPRAALKPAPEPPQRASESKQLTDGSEEDEDEGQSEEGPE